VRDAADAFGPLKSVAGGLCFILENCEVRSSFHIRNRNSYGYLSARRQTNKQSSRWHPGSRHSLNCSAYTCFRGRRQGAREEKEPRTVSLHIWTLRRESHRKGIDRKLEDIHRDLALLGEQGKAKGFFNNVENADRLSGLVEDIRDAIMDYQVCALT
jgi:hypothetical protein